MLNAQGSLQVEIGSRTDIGRVRGNNEDSCVVLPSLNLFILSDGMGGESHGEIASAITSDTIAQYCSEEPSDTDTWSAYWEVRRPDLSEKTRRLASAVHSANHKIYETVQGDPLLHGMGATVVAAWLEGPQMSLAHVGDSRAYLLRSGTLRHLTSDHTLVAEQIRRGLIKPEQAHLSKMQNVLIRVLGVQEEVKLDATECMLIDRDIILLCTDGLTHMVPDAEIADVLSHSSEPQNSADNLVVLANEHGGEDNVSVIVLHITNIP